MSTVAPPAGSLRPRHWQLRRDLAFAGSMTMRVGGLVAASAVVGLVMWTLLPMVAGYRPNLVTSNSMAPSIEAGDVVLTRSIDRADLQPGQVVLIDDPDRDQPLLHRVRSVEGGELVTQGDANLTADTSSSDHVEVLGVGRVLVPGVGRPMMFLGDHPESLLVAAGVVLVGVGVRFSRRPRGFGRANAR